MRILLCLFLALCSPAIAFANPQLATIAGARANMDLRPPERWQSKRFAYPHELTIALPASYAAQPTRRYPVLWVLDGPLMTRLVVGSLDNLVIGNHAPEMIVIGIGSPASDGLAGVGRRIPEFSPPGKGYAPAGLGGSAWQELAPIPEFNHRADDFLAMLVDDLRPDLAKRFRFNGEHALFGHSAGGMFAFHALFARPEAFDKMIVGSPFLAGVGGAVIAQEAAFALSHHDLHTALFMGAGTAEGEEYFLSASGIVSEAARMAETLRLRRYPSLQLTFRLYEGEDHYTVVPRVLGEGIRALWHKEAAVLGSSWPQPETGGGAGK